MIHREPIKKRAIGDRELGLKASHERKRTIINSELENIVNYIEKRATKNRELRYEASHYLERTIEHSELLEIENHRKERAT